MHLNIILALCAGLVANASATPTGSKALTFVDTPAFEFDSDGSEFMNLTARDTRDISTCQSGDNKWAAIVDDIEWVNVGLRQNPKNIWTVCGKGASKMVYGKSKVFIQSTNRNQPDNVCEQSAYSDIALAAEWILKDCIYNQKGIPLARGFISANGNGRIQVFIGAN
ncbi:hypothetical protein CC79DRAFT_1326549 [Sarocladium strictum]